MDLSASTAHGQGEALRARGAARATVKDIAWKAQTRLCARYRALAGRGKMLTVAVTAVARELAGFVWAIEREVKPMPAA